VEEPVLPSDKNVLECAKTQMLGRTSAYPHDLFPEPFGLTVVLFVGDILGVKMYGLCEKGDKRTGKRRHLIAVKEVLSQLLRISEEVGIAVLDSDRQFIIAVIPVHHEDTGQILTSKDALRDRS
jgi:hypothetical protein